MKKILSIGILLLVLSVVLVGFNYPAKTDTNIPYQHHMGMGLGPHVISPMKVLMDLTGLTIDEIREMRLEGMSLIEIAEANEIEAEEFENAVLENRREMLKEMVDKGMITEELANARIEMMESMIKERLEDTDVCYPNEFKRGHMGRKMHGGFGAGMGHRGGNINCPNYLQ